MNNNYNNSNNTSLINEIKSKVDIVSVIGSYVTLTKKGANYIGLCPFHQDSNPSMSVSPTKGVFKCFSCNTAGDVISFVSKFKHITYTQAMRELGESVGIHFQLTKKELERKKNEKYYKITEEAAKFYHFYLENTIDANEAREYVHNRGLDDEVISRFQIGVSGDKDELFSVLEKKDFLPLDMIEVNLVRNYGTTYHDVFKNRVIFPLEDLDGNVVGFSGRKYKKDDPSDAKYVNTTDTVIFKKGNILYHYHSAISSIKEKNCVYLFEGFMDVIAAVRAGIDNSVASMGTALTQNQIQAIKRYTNNIIVGYDSDGPGVMATLKAIDLLIQEDFNIHVCQIPDGKDADEYIFKNGKDALHDCLVNKTINAIDFIYNFNLKYLLKEDINSVENFKNKIYEAIQKFNKLAITEAYLLKLSNEINISLESIKQDYEHYTSTHILEVKQPTNYTNQYSDNPYDYVPVEYGPIEDGMYPVDLDLMNQSENKSEVVPIIKSAHDNNFENKKLLYKRSEETLVIASYNSKTNCKHILATINYHFVEKVNRDILNKFLEHYSNYEIMDEKMIFAQLDDEQTRQLRRILNTSKLPDKVEISNETIDTCIENVKKYTFDRSINENMNVNTKESIENIVNCQKSKKIKFNTKYKKEI